VVVVRWYNCLCFGLLPVLVLLALTVVSPLALVARELLIEICFCAPRVLSAARVITIVGGIPTSNLVSAPSSGTLDFTTPQPVGRVRYFPMIWWHEATGQWQYASDLTPTVDIGGTLYPHGTVIIQGIDHEEPPEPLVPIDALGPVVTSNFYSAAIGETMSRASGEYMQNVYSAGNNVALGIGCLLGHSGAIARAIQATDYTLNTQSYTPLFTASYYGNTDNLLATMWTCMKYSPVWATLTTSQRNKINAAMKVHAFSTAFVTSDNNPWFISGNRPRTIRGYSANNPKFTAFNQSGQGHAGLLISMAFWGGPAALKNLLTSTTPAQVRSELLSVGFTTGSNLHRTMNWRNVDHTGATVLGTDTSDRAPTDAQIISAVTGNWLWCGLQLEDYHKILVSITSVRQPIGNSESRPWLAIGNHGDSLWRRQSNPPNKPILIGRGWGGWGLGSDPDGSGSQQASPVSSQGAAVNGCLDADVSNPPGYGLTGAPGEMFAQQDESARADPHYTIEGMRSLLGAWLSLWVAGLLNRTNADILAALPPLDRGVRCCEYCVSQGWNAYAHSKSSGHWPKSGWGIGSYLFQPWTEVLGPALGCGQVLKNCGFSDTSRWTLGTGVSITGGKQVMTSVAPGIGASQPIPLISGKYYQLSYTISARSAGSARLSIIGTTQVNDTTRSANGTYTTRIQAISGNTSLLINAVTTATMSFDDVTVTGPFETVTVDGN
jgi:hypothetical protein